MGYIFGVFHCHVFQEGHGGAADLFFGGEGGKGFVDVVFFFYLIPRWTLGSIFSLLWLCHVLAVRIKHRRWKYVYVFF